MKTARILTAWVTLATSMTSFAAPQQAQQPGFQNGGTLAPVTTVVVPPPPPRPAPVRMMVSAFEPFGRSETNMAQMVADAMLQITQSEDQFRHISIETMSLPVTYLDSSKTLIDRLHSMQQLPDYIVSIGQGTQQLTIETSGTSEGSSLRDVRGAIRQEANINFPGLENRIGFNFPVQDLWCGVDSKLRSKVNVSYTPGAFVCNDISYNMSQFVRPAREVDGILKQYDDASSYQAQTSLQSLTANFKPAYEKEVKKVADDKQAELPQLHQCLLALADVRARNEERRRRADAQREEDRKLREQQERQAKQNGVNVSYGNGGGQSDSRYSNQSYSNSGYSNYNVQTPQTLPAPTLSAQGRSYGPQDPSGGYQRDSYSDNGPVVGAPSESMEARYESEPDCRSRVNDSAAAMKSDYEGRVQAIQSDLNRKRTRLRELQQLFGIQGKSRFAFFHVPVSDGIAYTPDYTVADVKIINGWESAPYGWVEAGEAQRLLGHHDLKQTLRVGNAFLVEQQRRQEQQQREWDKQQQRNRGDREPSSSRDNRRGSNQDSQSSYAPDNRQGQDSWAKPPPVPTPPPPRMVFSLSAWQKKAVTKENNNAYQYAHMILQMFVGAIAMQKHKMPQGFPLPRLDNQNRFPVGASARAEAKTYLQTVSNTQILRTPIPNEDPKAKIQYSEQTIPPMMSGDLANCYIDFLNKVGSDEATERREGKTRY